VAGRDDALHKSNIGIPPNFVKSVFWINGIGVTDDMAKSLSQRSNSAFSAIPTT